VYLRLAEILPEKALEMKWFWKVGTAKLETPEQLHAVLSLLTSAAKIACTAAFLAQRYFADKPESLVDSATSALKPDVQAATAVLKLAGASALQIHGPVMADLKARGHLPRAADDFEGWFARANALVPHWGKALVQQSTAHMSALTTELTKLTPVYSHYISDASVNVAMVKKTLLQGRARELLAPKAKALFAARELCKGLWADWGGPPSDLGVVRPDQEHDPMEELDCADMAFLQAKKAISVIAACSVCYEPEVANREGQAEVLTATERPELVKPLLSILQKIAKKPVAKPGKAEVKTQ